ncbi:MAG: AsmA-like C-terminal region-containing protein [Bacteroidales bacterium]
MKKFFKWTAITLSGLIFLVIVAIAITVWFVFTPERLTPVVRKQAAEFITCKSEIGEVELTFFSTFPKFGLKVSKFALINPIPNAPSDTLVCADKFIGVVDVGAWWKRNEIVLTDLQLCDGAVNAFVDSLGNTNFDIVPADTVPAPVDTVESSMPFGLIDIKNVEFRNMNLSYTDKQQTLQAGIGNLAIKFSGTLASDSLAARVVASCEKLSFSYAGENYLNGVSIKMDIPTDVILSKQRVHFSNAEFSVNNLGVSFDGTVENDTINKRILTEVTYKIDSWSIPEVLALVPASYQSYLKGVEVDGLFSSKGEISGFYSDSVMPLMNIQLGYKDGSLKYAEFPLPLSKINGDFIFYSDLKNDATSYFKINSFSANTPKSSFKTSGIVRNLFSDIYCNLATQANLVLPEFAPLIPADMKVSLKGKVVGNVKSAFRMSQVEKMLIDKMNISGSAEMHDFDVTYDSMRLVTNYTKFDFALPNPNPKSSNSKFLYAKVNTKDLEASMLDGTFAKMRNALISIETSDVMDSTSIPNVSGTFAMDTLAAGMDTMNVAISRPRGGFSMLSPKGTGIIANVKVDYSSDMIGASMGSSLSVKVGKIQMNADVDNPMGEPKIKMAYSGENLDMNMGLDSVRIKSIKMDSKVENDSTQKEVFLQWSANGFLEMNQGYIRLASLTSPIEIPSIKMNFDPETFAIKESKMKIDRSDFSLSGTLSNVLSHFTKDSLLKGEFFFDSKTTDLLQLMSLTSGIGNIEEDTLKTTEPPADSALYAGPYMVPKGIDFLLKANVKTAVMGIDTAKNIKGDIRVKDGIMLLDGLVFTTPAARMQLTAMYRTPRKNHIYLGMDYHMLDIEISDLLNMIPDIDTIMPMLRSFKGKGEFHLAVETYLDSLYNPKKSTIRGATSIRGKDLVLMDGETFTEIAKTLRFSKHAQNKVDSLSAEFTVFKQEIDIYPFLIAMDKYKAVIAGRHNMDMSFNYHVSLVDSPLPIKLGVDISGTMDNLKIRPAKCKYADMARPAARGLVKDRQLELRRMIRESLTKKVIQEKSE